MIILFCRFVTRN